MAVTIRRWLTSDAAAVHAACQDPEIQRWITAIPLPYTRQDARDFVEGEHEHEYAIVVDGDAAGAIGMRADPVERSAAVGFWCAPHARRRGVTAAALHLLAERAFAAGVERLTLMADVDNVPSQRTAHRGGFRREGLLRGGIRYQDGRRADAFGFARLPGDPPETFLGLHHVQLALPPDGEDAARAFYAGELGMTEIPKPPALAARGGVWFQRGDVQLHLGVEAAFVPARKAHPAIEVADLDAVRADAEPDTDLPGYRRVYVHDPFGNRLELLSR